MAAVLLYVCVSCVCRKEIFMTKTIINCIIFHKYVLYTQFPRFSKEIFLLHSIDVGHSHITCFGQQNLSECEFRHIPVEALSALSGWAQPLLLSFPQKWACLQKRSSIGLALHVRRQLGAELGQSYPTATTTM